MPPDGDETLALWREAGEWWAEQPPREVHRFIDAGGNRREVARALPPLGDEELEADRQVHEISRARRVSHDKVAIACGMVHAPDLAKFVPSTEKIPFATLHTVSGYAFGRGAMIAATIPSLAAARGSGAVLLADPFALTGAAEFAQTAEQVGVKPLIGASFEMAEGGEIVLVARTRSGFRSLSRLITECHLDEPRLFPLCTWERLERHTEDLLCLTGGDSGPVNRALTKGCHETAKTWLDRLIGLYGRENVFVEIERTYLPWQFSVNRRLLELADEMRLTAVAGGPITHARPDQFPAQDMLGCIETLCLIEEVDGRKPRRHPSQPQVQHLPWRGLNAERRLRTADEMSAIFADRPDLVANTLKVADRCERSVLPGRTELPRFSDDENGLFRELTLQGARNRYGQFGRELHVRLDLEIERIARLGYAGHFLIAWDMCRWARENGILFSGRGSVVDSVVAYCLGCSRIDAFEHDLFFDRFLPADGSKRPDIDIDFEARRRDDVRHYLAQKYGERHVATVAAVGTYGTRGIVREVGKVMGIPPENMEYLSKRLHGSVSAHRLEQEIDLKPELRDSGIPRERFRWVFQLARELMDIPRNMRSHSSGVVISRNPIADTVPVMYSGVEDVRIIQWDKRSAKRCFDKFDVLCLRGNDVLSDTQRRTRAQVEDFSVETLPLDDPETYRAMRSGQLIGIPQSASPAMRQAHIRLRTQNFRDAGIVQAAIRPGVGGAVKINEFIARRRGKPFSFSHPELQRILGPTHGIVVFQEQIDQLLQTFGGYTSDEAEEIREAIHKRRREDYVRNIKDNVVGNIQQNGFTREVAEEVYELVGGFQGYGFAEGHALAFAEISIRSIWCQQNYPSEYFAAMLDAQPAGYYGPCTLVNEARIRGVKVLPPDINRSEVTFSVEDVLSEEDPKLIVPNGGIRIALKQISGLSEATRERTVESRNGGCYCSLFDYVARVRPDRDELERLILCGCFDTLERNRRSLLWAIPSAIEFADLVEATRTTLPLIPNEPPLPAGIAGFARKEEVLYERAILDLDVEKHLMAFERPRILAKGGITAAEASVLPNNVRGFAVGNPIRLRFPPTVSGKRVLFFDLEDETGLLNVTCFDDTYQRFGHSVICSPYVTVRGVAQDRDGHIAFLAHEIYPFKPSIHDQTPASAPLPITTADFLVG
ncbi:MAG: DNA polymerase III subunit alpha [Fimbriimonas sp.]|nr:DNA polymerase III subunit alpha [Fimbriimonas sp.]